MSSVLRDARYAARLLARNPGFTAVAVLTLALGIGGTTAIFSITNALLLRSLPVSHPEELRLLSQSTPERELPVFSLAAISAFSRSAPVSAAGAYGTPGPALISTAGNLETVHREQASSAYFRTLGLRPAAGRFFTGDEDRAASGNVIISHAYWRRRFNGSPSAIGGRVEFARRQFTVIGVAPEGFGGSTPERAADLWFSIGDGRPQCLADPACEAYKVLLRLRPGVSNTQAAAALRAVFRQHLRERAAALPKAEQARVLGRQLILSNGGSGDSQLGRAFRKPLAVLMALVAVLLLLACANLGNMLLARGAARTREMAVRMAIGAARGHLIRQLMIESLMVSLAGGAVALLLANWAASAMVRAYTDPRLHLSIDVAPDWRVLAFTAAVSICTGVLFGLMPAFRATRLSIAPALKGTGVSPFGARRATAGKVLAAWQVALSIMLLAGASLFIRSLANLKTLDTGYTREHVVTFSVATSSGYAFDADAATWRLLDKVRSLPGVVAASAASPAPPEGGPMFRVKVDGYQPRPGEDPMVRIIDVSDGFFETVRTPLMQGRLTGAADRGRKPNVAVVNESFARRFFGRRDPVGRLIEVGSNYGGGNVVSRTEIVGVVADARYSHPKERPLPTVFPYSPFLWASGIVVRTADDPARFIAALPRFIRETEPSLRLADAGTMASAMDKTLTQERMLADVSGFFGTLAIVLASVGIYGITAYGVRQRTAEFGIRIALGAAGRSIVWMIIKETLILLGTGLAAGVPVVLIAGRALGSLLFELKPADPATITAAVVLLSGVAIVAGYLPARQAARVQPVHALRAQ